MNMLQSIFKVWYTPLLSKFQTLLGWKRIQADVRGCYYQASRLVNFVYDEMLRYLMHLFISDNMQKYKDNMSDPLYSDSDTVCLIAKDFNSFLNRMKKCGDEWTRTCVLFVIMAGDFFKFVSAYRNADAVGVEMGYCRFAPVWQQLGQTKYLERHWDQQEVLLRKFLFIRDSCNLENGNLRNNTSC